VGGGEGELRARVTGTRLDILGLLLDTSGHQIPLVTPSPSPQPKKSHPFLPFFSASFRCFLFHCSSFHCVSLLSFLHSLSGLILFCFTCFSSLSHVLFSSLDPFFHLPFFFLPPIFLRKFDFLSQFYPSFFCVTPPVLFLSLFVFFLTPFLPFLHKGCTRTFKK
jgi:hypothetical protein